MSARVLLAVAVLVPAAAGAAAAPPRLVYEVAVGAGVGAIEVRGLEHAALERIAAAGPGLGVWEELLAVRVASAGGSDGALPPVLGSYRVGGGVLRFEPRFAFAPGLELVAVFDGAAFDEFGQRPGGAAATPSAELTFSAPAAPRGPPTRVRAVYPSAEVVPENLLRLYVHFSAPMRRAEVARGVRLFEVGAGEVELPFVEVESGLWDPSSRRLTLFLHPGRIKRGVGPHRALGPPLTAGRRYRLVVGRELRDHTGLPLAEPFEKSFLAGPADRDSPDPGSWLLAAPDSAAGELVVDLPEPLDHALLARLVVVRGPRGELVRGRVTISRAEKRWTFAPQAPWSPGRYFLRVPATVEDLAGNKPGALFEEMAGTAAVESAPEVEIEFEVPS